MSLKEKIINDLTAAMKAKDADKTSALRMVKAAIMVREKEKEEGAQVNDEEVTKRVKCLVKKRSI